MVNKVILDSDIASQFAKIERISALKKLFSKHKLVITPKIYQELSVALDYGYDFPNNIFDEIAVLNTKEEEEKKFEKMLRGEVKDLGRGEVEAIIICENRNYIFCSFDKRAIDFAKEKGVKTIGLHVILRSFWKSGLVEKKDVKKMIDEIEEKDRTRIKNKEKIFTD